MRTIREVLWPIALTLIVAYVAYYVAQDVAGGAIKLVGLWG